MIVLGSGTSNGVPMLGVDYTPEFLANPRNHRTRSSILIRGPEGNLLVDCAPEMRLQLLREGIKRVDHTLITHTHADHIMGMDDLRSFCIQTGGAMPVTTLPRYMDDIRRVFAYAFEEAPPGLFIPRFDLRPLEETMDVVGLKVTTFLVEHGMTPVVGLRIGDFAYLTDVSRIPPQAEAHLHGLKTLFIDAVRLRSHPTHLNLEGALGEIARLKPEIAYLTHLSHDYNAGNPPPLPANVRLSFDGLRVELT